MKRLLLPLLFALVPFSSRVAVADPVTVAILSYDVTYDSTSGNPLTAAFDITNFTGTSSSTYPDTTFPVVTPLSLANLSLVVQYIGGQTKTFGSSYFTTPDGMNFSGTELSVLLGYPGGLDNAIGATLTGTIATGPVLLNDGTSLPIMPNFSATISDSAGLQDGDFGLINAVPTPEPSAWILSLSGVAGLLLLRRQSRLGRTCGAAFTLLGAATLAASAASASASTVTLAAWTSPTSGAAGSSSVNVTGSGFPSGGIPAANVTVTLAAACGTAGATAPVSSVRTLVGTSDRVQFVVPAGLSTGTYYVSVSGSNSGGTPFSSGNCAEINVTGSSPTASLSAASVSFSSTTAGSSSPTQTVTLSNTGTATLNLSGITLSGTGANLFPESNNCPAALTVGAYCTITVGFAPMVQGAYGASINIADDASSSPQTISLSGSATPFAITLDTSNPADWKISNGALSLDWNPSKQRIFHIYLAGYSDDLTDQTNSNAGIYMDNSGFGSGTTTTGYNNAGSYLDWWVTTNSSSTNAYTYTVHYVVFPNDPGVHTYFVAVHKTSDIAGGIGQVQWVYRSNLNDFTNTYSVNQDLSNPGPVIVPLPPASEMFSTDPGRAVSDATVDLHGFTLPAGFTRQFYTKYDYSQYNYLHQAHGTFGNTFGVWTYLPSNETLVAGPTKQNLVFTGNLLMIEAYSNHLDNGLSLATAAGVASSRLFGPFYIHFNTFGQAYNGTGNAINTPDDMYADTLAAGSTFQSAYDNETQLLGAGYVPSTQRGSVSIQVPNVPALTGGTGKKAWAVLSDPGKNHESSSHGYQYWADISATGSATINGVVPGTYRLSVYVLGQFGELRQDGIAVTANQTTTVPAVNFVPENFASLPDGSSNVGETVFTIGTPDRSSHEFLHGHDAQGHDDREFFGTWNYWADFAANSGSVVYYATPVGSNPATNNLNLWNYDHWGVFDPGLYDASDDKTDNYQNVIPSYVATLPGASGTNGVTTRPPTWTLHFATPQDFANYKYVELSIAMACNYGSYVTGLNGTARTWSFGGSTGVTTSDCAVRSGLSGYTNWVVFEFPVSALTQTAGGDNVLTLGVSQTYGVEDDALRLELTTVPSTPSSTGWNDYEYVNTSNTAHNIHANDAVPNP